MGLKKYFMDNETYGADDVNAAFSHLVTSGVSLFDGTKSLISELDEAVSDTVNSGVDTYNEDSCKVVYENGAYSVKPGVCFMPNGMRLIPTDISSVCRRARLAMYMPSIRRRKTSYALQYRKRRAAKEAYRLRKSMRAERLRTRGSWHIQRRL